MLSQVNEIKIYKIKSFLYSLLTILVVVNMILINMMMAIINMAFEDIKSQTDKFKNKFEIMEYIKRSCKELSGVA